MNQGHSLDKVNYSKYYKNNVADDRKENYDPGR